MRPDRGSVLLVTVGLLAVMVTLTLAFLARMRADAEAGSAIVAQAQARWMLHAALTYLQESSRLGWAPSNTVGGDADAENATLVETCGWTDVRDGSLGPRPVRQRPGSAQPWWWGTGASWPTYSTLNPPTPPPTWWTYLTPYRLDPADWDAAGSDTYLPSAGGRRWPCPGSVVRVEAYALDLPAYAVRPLATANPVDASGNYWTTPVAGRDGTFFAASSTNWYQYVGHPTANAIWGSSGGSPVTGTGFGALDPQPVQADWNAFAAGDQVIDPMSRGGAWFRVYRELKADHNNDGTPWYDRIPLRGYSAFIVSVGAGGSRGFRFFSSGDAGWSTDVEPVTADSVFPDRATFELARRNETVLWFRVEWSGWTGGVFDAAWTYAPDQTSAGGADIHVGLTSRSGSGHSALNAHMLQNANPFGHFSWIQRLEREPAAW